MDKQHIIEKALEMIERSSVKTVTMDDIAQYLGISKRTIYECFESKEDLIAACVKEKFERRQTIFAEKDNVIDAILVLLQIGSRQQFNMIKDLRKFYPQVYKEHLAQSCLNRHIEMEQLVLRGIREGIFRDDLNAEIIAYFFCTQVKEIIYNNSDFEKFSLSDVFENVAITFLRGICTAKGLEIIETNNA
jgi:AcrR family transcriptional regulator